MLHPLRDIDVRHWFKPLLVGFSVFAIAVILIALLHAALFGPRTQEGNAVEFVVSPEMNIQEVGRELQQKKLVRHSFIFQIAYALLRGDADVRAGGYQVSSTMDTWAIAKTLGQAPYLAWVSIPAGLRKEEVAEALKEQLSWNSEQEKEWLSATSASSTELSEGVFFPDTYLIPSDQSPEQVMERLRDRFESETASYKALSEERSLSWSEMLVLASLIERESAKNDKKLVSGILWNRLNKGMLLQVDATLQYVTGSEEEGWWHTPSSEDKYMESPYNTYLEKGLPPAPIATPSLASIDAALNPQKTSCLYYLHDSRGRIHCATTYKGHLANIRLYLR